MNRERVTVRRALLAGAAVWAVVTVPLLGAVLLGGSGGRQALPVVLLGGTCGGVVASGWLLLAALLDLMAGAPVGRGRAALTIGLSLATGLLPLLVVSAGG